MPIRWTGVCIDCADARELADFYTALLGWEVVASNDEWFQLAGAGERMHLNIQGEEWYEPPVWPERPGELTKMIHFEIYVDDLDAAIAHAITAGAREALPQPATRDPRTLRVMLDPAGHPFCLFTADG
jgi:catechol 2,3-dioxygenase-like lactoylglutathione lyase family enzyme